MISAIFDYLISFRFLNFIWMIACLCYAVKRWVLPDLVKAVAEEKNRIATVRSSIAQVKIDQQNSIDAMAAQNQKGREFYAKISAWNVFITQKNDIHKQQQRATLHNYQQYRMQQYRSVELLYAKQAIEQDVWNVTVHNLKHMYDNQAAQQGFFHHVFTEKNKEQE